MRAIAKYDYLNYCGEEDLLGHYLINYDDISKRHFIGTKRDDVNGFMIGEGEWHDFIETDVYKSTKKANEISYFWDELIQRTCQNSLDGTLGGNSDIVRGKSAIFEMVKEPRFFRRGLSNRIKNAVINFPDDVGKLARHVMFLPSYHANLGYVFFQLHAPAHLRSRADYREKRQTLLEIACGAVKNKFQYLSAVVGIGTDAPKYSGDENSEDFILMPCELWPDEMRMYYEELNKEWQFFQTDKLQQFNERLTQFVPSTDA